VAGFSRLAEPARPWAGAQQPAWPQRAQQARPIFDAGRLDARAGVVAARGAGAPGAHQVQVRADHALHEQVADQAGVAVGQRVAGPQDQVAVQAGIPAPRPAPPAREVRLCCTWVVLHMVLVLLLASSAGSGRPPAALLDHCRHCACHCTGLIGLSARAGAALRAPSLPAAPQSQPAMANDAYTTAAGQARLDMRMRSRSPRPRILACLLRQPLLFAQRAALAHTQVLQGGHGGTGRRRRWRVRGCSGCRRWSRRCRRRRAAPPRSGTPACAPLTEAQRYVLYSVERSRGRTEHTLSPLSTRDQGPGTWDLGPGTHTLYSTDALRTITIDMVTCSPWKLFYGPLETSTAAGGC